MPEEHRRYGETWEKHHPDWEMRLWGAPGRCPDMPPLINQDLYDYPEEWISPRSNPWQFRSDVVRLEVLWHFGGVYVDTDFECLRPLDPLLTEDVTCFAAWEREGLWLNNAILGSTRGHPFIWRLIVGLRERARTHKGERPNVISGPRLLTAEFNKDREGVTPFPKVLFYPYGWWELGTPEERGPWPWAFAVHHWQNKRRERGS